MKEFITELKERVLSGGTITLDEAKQLIELPLSDDAVINHLIEASREITDRLCGREADLCSLINAKSGNCTEDCAFCSQSSHHQTGIDNYEVIDEEEILAGGKRAESLGVDRFCVVTATGTPTDEEFEKVLAGFRRLRAETNLKLEASIGNLSKERLMLLKGAGVTRINHNSLLKNQHNTHRHKSAEFYTLFYILYI